MGWECYSDFPRTVRAQAGGGSVGRGLGHRVEPVQGVTGMSPAPWCQDQHRRESSLSLLPRPPRRDRSIPRWLRGGCWQQGEVAEDLLGGSGVQVAEMLLLPGKGSKDSLWGILRDGILPEKGKASPGANAGTGAPLFWGGGHCWGRGGSPGRAPIPCPARARPGGARCRGEHQSRD